MATPLDSDPTMDSTPDPLDSTLLEQVSLEDTSPQDADSLLAEDSSLLTTASLLPSDLEEVSVLVVLVSSALLVAESSDLASDLLLDSALEPPPSLSQSEESTSLPTL